MTGTAVGHSLSRLGSMESQDYLLGGSQSTQAGCLKHPLSILSVQPTTYNYATQPRPTFAAILSVERSPTTVIRESTYNDLHAFIFHVSASPDNNTAPAGGDAYVPALASTIHD
ncbi:hypothetical protein BDB00DRAFT_873715 [Zychaea mexicana]|uniref:uncharacterized protein n=1 Tax=Zychaea mexicana TaxID=64656 RepID=UPI0022FED721|nr:uncharacterized protein BDB00DRAFT_873715 [Zychaea mexicana]KAI9492073.1 hypothetical protein BDB00DRAFT_873715 [Zychaea mexicana]